MCDIVLIMTLVHRIEILESLGLTMKAFQIHSWAYTFREECVFRKELKLSDVIFMHTTISKMTADASRWNIQHENAMLSPRTTFFTVGDRTHKHPKSFLIN
jgi:acyl-CoA thioesterase FadM